MHSRLVTPHQIDEALMAGIIIIQGRPYVSEPRAFREERRKGICLYMVYVYLSCYPQRATLSYYHIGLASQNIRSVAISVWGPRIQLGIVCGGRLILHQNSFTPQVWAVLEVCAHACSIQHTAQSICWPSPHRTAKYVYIQYRSGERNISSHKPINRRYQIIRKPSGERWPAYDTRNPYRYMMVQLNHPERFPTQTVPCQHYPQQVSLPTCVTVSRI